MTTKAVRQLIAAAIAALGDPWQESAWAYDAFPNAEGQGVEHGIFVVGVPQTVSPNSLEGDPRRRAGAGGLAATRVMVRFLWLIRADGMTADTDAALDAEDSVRAAVLGAEGALHLSHVRADRQLVGDGTWMLVSLEFLASHRIALE